MNEAKELARLLKQAVRYIEVKDAYVGPMTANEVERRIMLNNIRRCTTIDIGANSVNVLATFDIGRALELIAQVEERA